MLVYAGAGSPTALGDILYARDVELTRDRLIAGGYAYLLNPGDEGFHQELEVNVAAHAEKLGRVALGTAYVLRWRKPPWNGWIESTLAVGNGLSYVTSIPELEARLEASNRLLYHLLFEVTARASAAWEVVFRIHHRSGAFGLFGGVTGGSDYMCLGARHRW